MCEVSEELTQLAVCRLLVVGHLRAMPFAVCRLLFVNLPSAVCRLPFCVCRLSSLVCFRLRAVCCLPCAVGRFCLPFSALVFGTAVDTAVKKGLLHQIAVAPKNTPYCRGERACLVPICGRVAVWRLVEAEVPSAVCCLPFCRLPFVVCCLLLAVCRLLLAFCRLPSSVFVRLPFAVLYLTPPQKPQ